MPLQVEELYDAYCIQRRLRDGASKMVAAFNSATGSREARESLSEANKGFRECTEVRARADVHASRNHMTRDAHPSVSAAHVLAGERVGKSHGRVSREDEG